ncbi:autoinducer binding domain-containing protein [Pseudomonas sp.]|uniref:autoinducer binding domain-containing protein n=1 Tax=Pseudomonas sp. TaxID=306 RepID=UPI003CC6D978
MKHWPEAQLHRLQHLTDEGDILQTAFQLAHDMGFDYLGFATAPSTSTAQLEGVSNLPIAWCTRYQQQGYVRHDPTVRHCRHSVVPLLWSDTVFSPTPVLRRDAWAHGIRHGLSLAVHGTCGQMSMLSLIREELAVSADEFCLKAGHCLWLGNLLHQRLSGQLLNPLDGSHGHLSKREVEVLRWSAQGKTAGDIGAILSLSERTVNFHISSAVKKLGMGNKTAAIVHAAQAGLL